MARKHTILYVRARNRIIWWVRAKKHTPKKMDKYALFFNKKSLIMSVITYFWVIPQIHFFSQPQKEKRKKKWNSAVLNDTVLLFPLHTQRQGKKMFCSPITPISLSPSTHLHKPKSIDTTYAPHWHRRKKKWTSPASGCLVVTRTPPTPVPWLDRGSRPLSPFFPYKYHFFPYKYQ